MNSYRIQQFETTRWSGGTTTQLYIYPPTTSLQECNFLFRLSTATVEQETTSFTSLPGYERILIPLSGRLKLRHETEHGYLEQSVETLQLARFKGDWITTGKGLLVDFNVIFRPEWQVAVEIHSLIIGQSISIQSDSKALVFLAQGSAFYLESTVKEPFLVELDAGEVVRLLAETSVVLIEVRLTEESRSL